MKFSIHYFGQFVLILALSGCAGLKTSSVSKNSGAEQKYQLLVAELALKRGDYDTAVSHYLMLAVELKDVQIAMRTAHIADYAEQYPEAIVAAKIWVERARKDKSDSANLLQGQHFLIVALVKNGQVNDAIKYLKQMVAKSGQERRLSYESIANVLGHKLKQDQALDTLQQFVERYKKDVFGHYAQSLLALRFGQYDLAQRAIDKALQEKNPRAHFIMQRAKILRLKGKVDEAIGYLEGELGRKPTDTAVRLLYAQFLFGELEYERALKEYLYLEQAGTQDSEALLNIAILYLGEDRLNMAEQYLMKLQEGKERLAEGRYFMGYLEEKKGNDDRALELFYGVNGGQFYIDAQLHIASLLNKQGRLEKARTHLQSIRIKSAAEKVRVVVYEGELLRAGGRMEEAMHVLSEGLEIMPTSHELLYARAMVAEKLDQLHIVEQDLKKIIDQNPKNADALNALGYTLADRTGRYEEALGYIKKALELKPDDYYVIDSMGWVLFRLGHFNEAISLLSQAFALSEESDAEVAAHLGEALWSQGRKEDARAVWNRALEGSPDNSVLLEAMERQQN